MSPKTRKIKGKSKRLLGIRNLRSRKNTQNTENTETIAEDSSVTPATTVSNFETVPSTSTAETNILLESSSEDIETETAIPEIVSKPCGRRIVDIEHFIKSIQNLNQHKPFDCNFSNMEFIGEKRNGLISTFLLKCKMCSLEKELSTEDIKNEMQMNVNSAAVLSVITAGCGHSEMTQQHAVLNIPQMSYRQYAKHQQLVSNSIFDTMWSAMEEAGKEELALAREIGEVDAEGNGLISVIVDGAWSKRSYKVNYDAPSGVACIVGAKTGKVLFVASRNKFCPICSRAASKKNVPQIHKCFKNWKGTSTAMEADIILEGFRRSVEMHNLKYVRLVGDGDSSVYKKICIEKPYGPKTNVKKIECTNHLLRNYCSKLRDLAKKRLSSNNKLVSPKLRKLLSSNIERLRIGIRKAIIHHRNDQNSINTQIELLTRDIKNCPNHVFGKHVGCSDYFCNGSKQNEINYVPEMEECGFMDDISSCGNRLIQNIYSLILNMNNNAAETYNSIVSKFVGGKRINFAIKGSYDTRCKAAVISYNKREQYYSDIHKTMTTRSPGKYTKLYIEKQKRKRNSRQVRRQLFPNQKRRKTHAPADEDYGVEELEQVDVVVSEERKEEFINSIIKTPEEILNIEKLTRGQSKNPLWKEHRMNLLTASNFGSVCKLKKTTNPTKLVQRLLSSNFQGSAATRWGSDHEDIVKRDFENNFGLKINECGLFISKEYSYLGASPDGIIDKDTIVEIKCPYSAAKLTPEEGVAGKKIKCLKNEEGEWKLKKGDSYYYQVQGQMAISQAKYCYFIVWTPLGMIVDKIERDDQFWELMVVKLKKFYYDCMVPEILKGS